MDHREARDRARIQEIGVERAELLGEHEPLVDDGFRGQRADVEVVAAKLTAGRAAGALADREEHALEVGGRAGGAATHEELADARHRPARERPDGADVDGDVAPAEHLLAVVQDGSLEDRLLATAAGGALREEAHRHRQIAPRRKRERHDVTVKLVRELQEDPGAVTGARVAAGGAAVGEVAEDLQALGDDLVLGAPVEPRHEPQTAGIVLERRIVEALLGRKRHRSEYRLNDALRNTQFVTLTKCGTDWQFLECRARRSGSRDRFTAMKRLMIVVALAVSGCGSSSGESPADSGVPDAFSGFPDAGPAVDARCPTRSDAGGDIVVAAAVRVVQFETGAAPAGEVNVEFHSAWTSSVPFPEGCAPVASTTVGPEAQHVATFGPMPAPASFVGALYVSGVSQARSINDRRLLFPCAGTCTLGTPEQPYPIFVLLRETLEAWNTTIGADLESEGLVVVTYRDGQGQPVPGVVPLGQRVPGAFMPLVVGQEVFFLAADRRTLETRTTTGPSGTAVIRLAAGEEMDLQGMVSGVSFEHGITVGTVADGVFFEQIDPQ